MRQNLRPVMRTRFSKKLWERWLGRLNGPDPNDSQVKNLSAGIQQFRLLCAQREKDLV